MAKQPKPKVWWCVKDRDGELIQFGVGDTRKAAIAAIVEFYLETWDGLKKQGYSVVKIEVREVTP